ncbi:hypothetical protein M407DRAFT_4695 [Tulasnella calospora MUT 4182]|uniref:Uncharacterized protein n=1 Tax=Tulasnella calospora MUT 4182 TaxID=1051891 RepID=A0A0C3QIZ3_9AGAM|nr:hypothetical protein M407DRAFT_4695 [Tulasnella calospora MUT 4182]
MNRKIASLHPSTHEVRTLLSLTKVLNRLTRFIERNPRTSETHPEACDVASKRINDLGADFVDNGLNSKEKSQAAPLVSDTPEGPKPPKAAPHESVALDKSPKNSVTITLTITALGGKTLKVTDVCPSHTVGKPYMTLDFFFSYFLNLPSLPSTENLVGQRYWEYGAGVQEAKELVARNILFTIKVDENNIK